MADLPIQNPLPGSPPNWGPRPLARYEFPSASRAQPIAPVPTHTLVVLPKFEFTTAFGLNEVLSDLGMPSAFTRGVADFGGMTAEDRLFIQAVVHKAYVRVDEKGTEAAAATAVVMGIESALPQPAARFIADRPFLFLIRHTPSGAVLFQGRVSDPRS